MSIQIRFLLFISILPLHPHTPSPPRRAGPGLVSAALCGCVLESEPRPGWGPPRGAHPYFQRWMVTAQQGRRLAGVDQADTSFRRGFPPSLLFHSSFFHPFSTFTSATFRRSCLAFVSARPDSSAVFSHTFAYQCCFGLSCRGKRRF